MPWHKNACLLLHGKVTHYNPNKFFSVGSSKCLLAASHWETEHAEGSRGLQELSSLSDVMNLFSVSPGLSFVSISLLKEYFNIL